MAQTLSNKLSETLEPATNNGMSLVSILQAQLLANNVFTNQRDIDGYLGLNTLKALLTYASQKGIPVSTITGLNTNSLKALYKQMFDSIGEPQAVLTDSVLSDVINDYASTSEYSYILGYEYETVDDSFKSRVDKYKFPDSIIGEYITTTPYSFGYNSYKEPPKNSSSWYRTYKHGDNDVVYKTDKNGNIIQEYDWYKKYKWGSGQYYGSETTGKYKFGTGKFGENDYWSHSGNFAGLFYNNINEAAMDSTDFKSYIINLATNHWVPLPVLPESVNEAVASQWNDTTIIGRSAGYRSYQGTSNRTVNFNLKLHMDLLSDLSKSGLDLTAITDYLKALTYPEYGKSELRPPVVILKLADVIKLRGTCDSVSITYELPLKTMIKSVRHKGDLMYSQCNVSLQFTEIPVKAPSAKEIEQGKQFYIKE